MLTTDYGVAVAPNERSNRMNDDERDQVRAAQERVNRAEVELESALDARDALFYRLKRDRDVGATEIAREAVRRTGEAMHRTVVERIFRERGGRRST